MGAKLDTEKAGRKRSDDLEAMRAKWADLINERLRENGIAARVDHRSLEAQGIDREPTQHLGPAASGYERRTGQPSDKRIQQEREAVERLARAKDLGELERQSRQIDQSILDLSGNINAAKAERQDALEARLAAEREAAEIARRREVILTRAQARQQGRDILYRVKTESRWSQRKSKRQNRQRDALTASEQRSGIRHPEAPQWQAYRERMLTEAYNRDVAQALGRWVRIERMPEGLRIHNRHMDLTDHGDRITAGMGGQEKEIGAMLTLAKAKGWERLDITGSPEFQENLGRAALHAGFALADTDLRERILEQRRQDTAEREVALRSQAPVLGEWMQAHPKRGALLKAAGRWLPGAPAGVEDWSAKAWEAAEAWRIGRHGTAEERQRLKTEGTALQRDCAGDGREVALHTGAQQGLGLRIGADAPSPVRGGLVWTRGEMTREQIERSARDIETRKTSFGVSHALVVTFGSRVPEAQRVLVYEHLLRSGLEVRKPAQEGRAQYETAQERLFTHHADGSEQQWVIDRRTREAQAAKENAEREARAAKEKAEREAQEKREADRKKLGEAAKDLGREVGLHGKSEDRNRRAAALLEEARRLEVTDLNKAYAIGMAEGRKEAALEACRRAGAAIQSAYGDGEQRAWEGEGILTKDAEGALYAGRDAVRWEQEDQLAREIDLDGPGR